MKKKILIACNLDSFIFKFLIPNLKLLNENNYEIHIASNGTTKREDIPYCDKKFNVCFTRNMINIDNVNSYKEMKKIIEEGNYDLIHCHTPFGAAITRLAAKNVKLEKKPKIIYTAHGFHFYKGAPVKNWLLFYNAEKKLADNTDTIITINKEDYEVAKNKFNVNVEYVPGVGIDEKKFDFDFNKEDNKKIRKSLGIHENDIVLIYPAELSRRKRQKWLIKTLEPLLKNNKNIQLVLPGNDILNNELQTYAKSLGLHNVRFLGFRKDIPKLLKMSDILVASSRQEGLPVNIMEAMFVGLPIVATDCRGQRDLIINDLNGYLVGINESKEFLNSIEKLINNHSLRIKMGHESKKMIEEYRLNNIIKEMDNIYKKI